MIHNRKKSAVIILTLAGVLILWSSSYKSKHRAYEIHGSMEAGDTHAPHNSTAGIKQGASDDSSPLSERNAKLKKLLLEYNAKIVFFGRVIDHNGAPLKGAKVIFDILLAGDLFPKFGLQRTDDGIASTDNNGMFQITKGKGMSMTISSIELQGYRDVRGGPLRTYSFGSGSNQHYPDPLHPVEFLLIGKEAAKPLVNTFKLAFDWDSKPVSKPIGDTDVVIHYIPFRNRPPGALRDFDWSMEISVEHGKVCRLASESALIAPIDGYQKSVKYGSIASEPTLPQGIGQESLVFITNDGKYGRIVTSLYVNRDNDRPAAYVTVHYNPSGGRNLE